MSLGSAQAGGFLIFGAAAERAEGTAGAIYLTKDQLDAAFKHVKRERAAVIGAKGVFASIPSGAPAVHGKK